MQSATFKTQDQFFGLDSNRISWIMDVIREWVENGLELKAKGLRTQVTSRNSIRASQKLDSGPCFVFCVFHGFGIQDHMSQILPEQYSTGVG